MSIVDYVALVIIAGIVIYKMLQTNKTKTTKKKVSPETEKTLSKVKTFVEKVKTLDRDWILPVIAVSVFHILMYFSFEWYSKFVTNWRFWITQIAVVGVFIFLRPMDKSLRTPAKRMSGWGALVLVGLVLWNGTYLKKEWWDNKVTSEDEVVVEDFSPPPLPGHNPEGEKAAREFWKKYTKSSDDFDLMVETILPRESNFNQFETDGVTPLTGRENSKDKGLHQINMDSWEEQVKKFPDHEVTLGDKTLKIKDINPLTEEGNYLAALYLYNQRGLEPWSASLAKIDKQEEGRGVIIVIAPTDLRWSQPVVIPPHSKFTWSRIGERLTEMRVNGSKVITLDPKNTESLNLGKVYSLEVRSLEKEPEKFKIEF